MSLTQRGSKSNSLNEQLLSGNVAPRLFWEKQLRVPGCLLDQFFQN